MSFKKPPRSRCINVPNKSYGEKYPTTGGWVISAHPVYYISSGTSSKCSILFPCDKNEIISLFCKDTYGSLPKLNISYIKTPNDHLKNVRLDQNSKIKDVTYRIFLKIDVPTTLRSIAILLEVVLLMMLDKLRCLDRSHSKAQNLIPEKFCLDVKWCDLAW